MKPYLKSALIYASFGVTWILLSDRAVSALWSDPKSMALAQTLKG